MGDSKEENRSASGWMSVPAFGEWDMKNGVPDYSLDFTKIREMRKHNKNASRASLGNDDEFLSCNKLSSDKKPQHEDEDSRRRSRTDSPPDLHHASPTGRKKFMGCFQCCIGA